MPHSKSSNDSSRSSRSSSGYFEEYSSDDSNSSMYSHTSLLITPSNPKAVNTSVCDKMYPALAADLKGCFAMVEDSDQRFEEYIKNVYGLTQDDVDYVNNKHKKGGWVLDGKHLREFQRVVAEHDHETKLYAPFKGMADVFYKVMERDRHSIDVELRTLGSMQLKCPYSKVTRKPDGLFLLKSLPSKPTWAYAKAYLEMYLKKKTTPSQPTIEPISFEASSSKQAKPRKSSASVAKPPAIKAQSTNALFTPAEKPKQLPDRRHSDDYSYPRRSTRACAIQSLAKIQAIQEEEEEEEGDGHGNDDDGDEGFFGEATSKVGSKRKQTTTETSSSRKRVNVGITRKVCQSASYALESLSATPRRWSTGLLIEGSVISVQYFDRCGGIVTPPFDFIDEPHKFALILLGIGKASLTQAGYDPYFVAPDSKSLANSLPTITDAHLILPPLAPTDADELYTGSTTPDDTWSRFVIKEDPLYVYHGLNGRGSMVWPGTWQRKEAVEDGEDKEADADSVPVVSAVVPEEGDDDKLGQIVKLSWPDKGRPRHEPKILQELFEKMPAEMHEYLPQVHASVLMTADVAGLPRAFFINQAVGNLKRQFEFGIRHFAIMIVDRYRYLWTVETVEEFENVYVDLVKGHYYAFRYAGILHRDLSENNLMWKRKHGKALGIVIDWDLASPIDDATDSLLARTGTGPFMAIDLLSPTYLSGHLYRHDLESMFYILIWAMTHYVLGPNPTRLPTPQPLARWELSDNPENAADAKTSFILKSASRDRVYECILPGFQSLADKWCLRLWRLFSDAHYAAERDDINLAESITFEAYMKALQHDERLPEPAAPPSSPSEATSI